MYYLHALAKPIYFKYILFIGWLKLVIGILLKYFCILHY